MQGLQFTLFPQIMPQVSRTPAGFLGHGALHTPWGFDPTSSFSFLEKTLLSHHPGLDNALPAACPAVPWPLGPATSCPPAQSCPCPQRQLGRAYARNLSLFQPKTQKIQPTSLHPTNVMHGTMSLCLLLAVLPVQTPLCSLISVLSSNRDFAF